MYYKIINDRQVFSQCKSIQMPDGTWISNPSEEQIAEAGWMVYVPPEVIPSPQTEPDYEDVLSAIKKMFQADIEQMSDEEALEVAALYPTWSSKVGETVSTGERLWYDGELYKVLQGHTVQDNWTPDVSTSLYVVVSIEEWPEWVQPLGSQDAYMTGDKVTFEGEHYISTMDNNIWSPSAYPAAWSKQD